MTYRILSFDGGGIRGVYSAVLLRRLVEARPDVVFAAHLIAGTSTGGIIALALASGIPPSDIVQLYRDNARHIFSDSWFDDLKDVGTLFGANYDSKNLESLLHQKLGEGTLDGLNCKVLIPTFDLDTEDPDPRKRTWRPKMFHNYPGADSDGREKVVDVALRTSAAPTYFPSYQGFIDGGVAANNPSMCALAQALDASCGGRKLEELAMLSLGTGRMPTYVAGQKLDWGLGRWAKPMIDILIDGNMGVADYQASRLLCDRYFRLAPDLPQAIALDDVDKVELLVSLAEGVDLTAAFDWLDTQYFGDTFAHTIPGLPLTPHV